ncbi:MAG: 4Fe-4S dicluster domain-containing protein [Desulfobacterales bacterium]|jgi:tetrathionate reductase subunit B|nr:4Fe-4S dicluster domain-containing protein [Deltaproteobacteria bacterium]
MKQSTPKKYGIVIDASKCIDCKACMIACKVENNVPEGAWRNWIRPLWDMGVGRKTEFQPGQCMQCDTPSCVAACPVNATYKQPDGLVAIDPKKCIGCGNCVTACPYGARYRNTARQIADKCDFCQQRLKRGEEPACVVTCPTKTRIFGDLNDPQSDVSRLLKEEKMVRVTAPHVDTRPNIYYHQGTRLLDWAVTPTLPGNVHMSREFWEQS